MAYIGKSIESGTFSVLDTSGNTYNGSNTTFNLGTQVGSVAQLLVSHDGVLQKPGTDYTLASGGTQITFTTAPASGASIFIVEISGAVGGTITPSDTSVTADKLNTALLTGHTDIGANLADADLFLVDDGAGGTLRKTAASRLKTYVGAGAGAFSITNLDIDGGTDIGAAIADADLFVIDDGAGGTNRKTAASRLKTYIGSPGLVPLAQLASSSDTSTLALDSFMDASSYAYYKIFAAVKSAGNGVTLEARFRDGGSALTASVYDYANFAYIGEVGTANNGAHDQNHADLFADGSTNTATFEFTILPDNSIGNQSMSSCFWSSFDLKYNSNTRRARTHMGGFTFVNDTVPDGFQIANQSANFEDYAMYAYGVKKYS